MTMAMEDAGVDPADIDYVNAHGTSTPAGDSAETRALKLALGEERARQMPISSTKGVTGHMLGAAGALEAGVTLLAMRDGFVPPTINQTDPDPDCDLDYVPNVGRGAEFDVAVSNSFGFGGHNAVLVLRRWPDAESQPFGPCIVEAARSRGRPDISVDITRVADGDGAPAEPAARAAATPAPCAGRTTARTRWSRTCACARAAATTSRYGARSGSCS